MEKQEQDALLKMERKFELFKLLLLIILFLALIIGGIFMATYKKDYPCEDELFYEDCTFIRYEYKTSSKSRYYLIYVSEYEQPLRISSIASAKVNQNLLSAVSKGDSIRISVDGPTEKQPYLYCISYRSNDILSYEDNLVSQRGNDQVRTWVGVAFILLNVSGLFLGIRHYVKTGKCPPIRHRFHS